jgi:hypothetical protein
MATDTVSLYGRDTPEEPGEEGWQVTRDPALKAEANRLQRQVTRRLNEWRNDQWCATKNPSIPRPIAVEDDQPGDETF